MAKPKVKDSQGLTFEERKVLRGRGLKQGSDAWNKAAQKFATPTVSEAQKSIRARGMSPTSVEGKAAQAQIMRSGQLPSMGAQPDPMGPRMTSKVRGTSGSRAGRGDLLSGDLFSKGMSDIPAPSIDTGMLSPAEQRKQLFESSQAIFEEPEFGSTLEESVVTQVQEAAPMPDPFDITGEQLLEAQGIRLEEFAAEMGLDPSVVQSTNIRDVIARGMESLAGQRETAERQAEFGFAQTEQRLEDAARSGRAQLEATRTQLAPGREGAIGTGRLGAMEQLQTATARLIDRKNTQLQEARLQLDERMQFLAEAERSGQEDLIRRAQAAVQAAEMDIASAESDFLNAQNLAADQEMKQRQLGLGTVNSLVEMLGATGISAMPIETLRGVFTSNGLPGSMAVALQDAQAGLAEAEAAGDALKIQQAEANLAQTLLQIEDYGKTPQQKNLELLQELRDSGASQEMITEFKQMLGIAEVPDSYASFSGSTSGTGVPGTGSTVNSSVGEGKVTAYGSSLWSPGLDYQLSGGMGAEVILPFSFEVIEMSGEECEIQATGTKTGCNGGFGKQVKVRNTEDGREIWISHLANFGNIQVGQQFNAGTILGTQGNSGDTIGATGVHLDITMPDANGSLTHKGNTYLTPEQVASYFNVGGATADGRPIVQLEQKDRAKFDKELRSTKEYKALSAAQGAVDALDEFEKAFEAQGGDLEFFGEDAAELSSKYQATLLTLKEYFNLGAITGPDMEIMLGLIPDPTDPLNFRARLQGGGAAVTKGIENMKTQLGNTIGRQHDVLQNIYGQYGKDQLPSLGTVESILSELQTGLDIPEGPKVPGWQNEAKVSVREGVDDIK